MRESVKNGVHGRVAFSDARLRPVGIMITCRSIPPPLLLLERMYILTP